MPRAFPITEMHLFLIDRSRVTTQVTLDGKEIPFKEKGRRDFAESMIKRPPVQPKTDGDVEVPLVKLAYVRSGEKGELFNLGVIARKPEFLPWIAQALSAEAVAKFMAHVLDPVNGKVERFTLPGLHALNFMLYNSLGGGGVASLRIDPQGKAFAQQLLEFPIPIPTELLESAS